MAYILSQSEVNNTIKLFLGQLECAHLLLLSAASDTTPGYPDGIWIYDYEGNKSEILDGVHINSADWSPDGTKIAYSSATKLYVVNIDDGANNTQIATSAEVVAWRHGDKIVYDGDWVNVISSSGEARVTLINNSWSPQKASSDIVYYDGVDGIYSITVDRTDNTKLLSNYERSTLKLSFDNAKIVGGDLITGGGSWIGGIWAINVDGTQGKRLK